tara:strand:+ start:170 stop:427 length:258 start_codon:yes stop_codon:yes gene_type:complete
MRVRFAPKRLSSNTEWQKAITETRGCGCLLMKDSNPAYKRDQMAADRLYREVIDAVIRGDNRCYQFYMMHLAKIALKYTKNTQRG